MKLMLPFEVLLLHYIELSHIHNTLHCCFLAIIYIKEQLGTFLYFPMPNSLIHLLIFSNDPLAISNQLPVRQGSIKTRQWLLPLRECRGCVRSEQASGRRVPQSCWVSLTMAQNPSFVSWGDKYRPILLSFKLWWKEDKWNRTINRHLLRTEGQSHSFDIKNGFIAAARAQIT